MPCQIELSFFCRDVGDIRNPNLMTS
jgi:hypothetical protein